MTIPLLRMRFAIQFSAIVLTATFAPAFGFQSTTPALSLPSAANRFRPQQQQQQLQKPKQLSSQSWLSSPQAAPPSRLLASSSSPPPIKTNDEVKDPTTLISAQDNTTQQLSFLLIGSGIFLGSIAFLNLYDTLEVILPPSIFAPFYTILPCVLSGAFIAAGIAHFALEDTFTAFVPPKGSWGGLWQVPSPGSNQLGITYEQYHSFWSGIAEVFVGIWLLIATLLPGVLPLTLITYGSCEDPLIFSATTIPAAGMYFLTACVTPANIYMYTHNPVVPRIPALPYPVGHAARGVLQCALLAVFCKLTIHSLQ